MRDDDAQIPNGGMVNAPANPFDRNLDFRFHHLGKMLALVAGFQELSQDAVEAILGDRASEYVLTARSAEMAVAAEVDRLLDTVPPDLDSIDVWSGERVLFLGDSITDDWLSWRAILVGLLDRARPELRFTVIDQSISGATTVDLLRRARFVSAARPTLGFVMVGTNDSLAIGRGASKPMVGLDEYRGNLVEIRRHLLEAGVRRMVWLTPPPVNAEALKRETAGEAVPTSADETRTTSYGDAMIQLFTSDVVDTRTATDRWLQLLPDGIHPDIEAQSAIACQAVQHLARPHTPALDGGWS